MKNDANIRLDVENELRWELSLDEKGILVKVEDGGQLQGSFRTFPTAGQPKKLPSGSRRARDRKRH